MTTVAGVTGSYVTQITTQQQRQLAHRSQQIIRVVDDVPLAILIEAVQRVVTIAVLIFADLGSLLDEEQRATELLIRCPSMKGPLATGVRFRCSIEQLKRWERAAARDDRTLSGWIRRQLDQAAAKQQRKR